jgi:hypothetical protein
MQEVHFFSSLFSLFLKIADETAEVDDVSSATSVPKALSCSRHQRAATAAKSALIFC